LSVIMTLLIAIPRKNQRAGNVWVTSRRLFYFPL
jgi:hypothetical protein